MKEYDLIFFIGRMQPYHIAHAATVEKAKTLADNVCVLKGSANKPRSPKNPWLFQEIEHMIHISSGADVLVQPVNDHNSDPEWIADVDRQMNDAIVKFGANPNRIAIIGMKKDKSTYYLNHFKHIPFIEMDKVLAGDNNEVTIDATTIRSLIFTGHHNYVQSVLPEPVYDFIVDEFTKPDYTDSLIYRPELQMVYDMMAKYAGEPHIDYGYTQICDEHEYNEEYPKIYGDGPHVTVDSIVVQSGCTLMIRRRDVSGRGLWAFPGGFLDKNETIAEAFPRELREETELRVPSKVITGSVVARDVFDAVDRSQRARIITHAHLIKLNDEEKLPRIAGADDADKAVWVKIADFYKMAPVMFEDHYAMGCSMLARLKPEL